MRNMQRRKSRKPKHSPAMAATKTPSQQDVVSDDLNYELWARTVKAILVEKELWAVVENGIPPDPSKNPELAAATIQPEELSKWRDFVGKDTEALQILQSSLPDSVIKTLEPTSAKHLWDLLKEANEEQSKLGKKKLEQVMRIEEDGERIISSSFMDRLIKIAADPRLESNHHYLAITNMVISVSDSYDTTTDELIIMGQQKLTFNSFRHVLDITEAFTMTRTFYRLLARYKYRSPRDWEGYIRWITSMSDSYDGAALVMEQVVGVKNLTFNSTRELLDVYESLPPETINGILKGFVVGSSSHEEEVCYSPSDLRGLLKEAKLEMKDISSAASQSKQDCAITRVMRSRHERGECIRCGGKGHVFKDCIDVRQKQSRKGEASNVVGPVTFEKDMWMIYISATNHMTPHIKYFTTLDETRRVRIKSFTGHYVISEGMGDVRIMTNEGKKKTIKDVLYVPNINRNVLSVGQLTLAGYRVEMTGNECTIMDQNTGILFDQVLWEERGCFLRLQVVEDNLTSNC